MRRTLVVLAKAPIAGRSKTRLTPPCTPHQAAALAEAALVDTLRAVQRADIERRILVLDGMPGPWRLDGFEVLPQRGGSLDERLAAAYDDVLGATAAPTLLIGMDTPQVTPKQLDSAMDALVSCAGGAVLGDADDGGWWAIGLHRADPHVFVGVPMSRDDTAARQRLRLASLELSVEDLPTLRDVDRWDDAIAVAADCPGSRFAAGVDEVAGHVALTGATGSRWVRKHDIARDRVAS